MNHWTTHQNDNRRSAKTDRSFTIPLNLHWRYVSHLKPKPAWPPPARKDPWHRHPKLNPRVVFDRAFQIVSDGNSIYFGSSADDKIYCLDAKTGSEIWSFFAEAPIRLAPTLNNGKIYFSSDDSRIYCLNSQNGELIWLYDDTENNRKIPGNERIISNKPARTGVLIQNEIAYFCVGLFPNEGVKMIAVDAETGSVIWTRKHEDLSPQGYLIASETHLYVSTGRTTPIAFGIKNGDQVAHFGGPGGTYALLTDDDTLIHGGGNRTAELIGHTKSDDRFLTFGGLQMIADDDLIYILSENYVAAIDKNVYAEIAENWNAVADQYRKAENHLWDSREKLELFSARDQEPSALEHLENTIAETLKDLEQIGDELREIEKNGFKWRADRKRTFSMILAGDGLILGGENRVDLYDAKNGDLLWQTDVDGKVYGLAIANDQLFVSTDHGQIYAFGADQISTISHTPKVQNDFTSNSDLAEWMVSQSKTKKGYALVIGGHDGNLTFGLIENSEFQIIVADPDPDRVESLRRKFDLAGVYGDRVSVHLLQDRKLIYTDYLFNLIVANNFTDVTDRELMRILRPCGGVLIRLNDDNETDKVIVRGEIENSGEWTHLYADPSNKACSDDPLKDPTQLQWFGKPGPRKIINRHSRPMSPLVKNGRVFVPADNRVICADLFNGTALWELEVPNSRRIGALKDCGQMVLTSEFLYVASKDRCQAVRVENGEIAFEMKAPQLIADETREWGYVATIDDQIFGSGKKSGASFYKIGRFNCDQLEGDFREMIASDYLFSKNRFNGETLWYYHNRSVIFHNTITIGDGSIFLIESQNPDAVNEPDGRLRIDQFCASDTDLIALDQKTGRELWRSPFKFPFEHIMFLSYARGVILATGTYNIDDHVFYHLYAFDQRNGDPLWETSYDGGGTGGTHGEQWQHPVINGDRIYLRPYDFDLHTGKKGSYILHRGGHGCGGFSGSKNYLFGRGGNPRLYEIGDFETSGYPISKVNRPGCWINMIPANGLVIIPESSSGCTCAYPLQTSLCYIPKN